MGNSWAVFAKASTNRKRPVATGYQTVRPICIPINHQEMKTRLTLACLFLIGTIACLAMVYSGRLDQDTSGILANVGTEFIGILLTVLIIDWMYERRTAENECRRVAMSVLQELDHAVWVWQGDSRGFDLDELFTRIHIAEEEDPIPPYTQNLFMRLGSRCVGHLNLKADEVALSQELIEALKDLTRLELIRDPKRDFDFQQFKDILLKSVQALASACNLGHPIFIEIQPTAHRITSEEHQHYRHFGRQIDGGQQPLW